MIEFIGAISEEDLAKADKETIGMIKSRALVRYKDCKHHHYESEDIPYCDRIDYGYGWKDYDFCSRAERRTDE